MKKFNWRTSLTFSPSSPPSPPVGEKAQDLFRLPPLVGEKAQGEEGRRKVGALITLLLFLFAAPLSGQIIVGVLPEDVSRVQPYVTQATQAGQRVTLNSFSESELYHQILGGLKLARIDVAQSLTKWLPHIQGQLVDLTPHSSALEKAGVELYSYGKRILGVRLPWRDDAFLAILVRSPRVSAALEFLKLFRAAAPGVTPLSFAVGPLVIAKPEKKYVGVDGALEGLLGALRQAVPTEIVTALAYLPMAAQDALRRVAEMWGIPVSADGTSVTLVIEPVAAVAPLALGARETQASPLGLQEVVVPLANLEGFLAKIAGKAKVRLPFEPIPLSVTSQGVGLVGASAFHAQGIRGAGVKIAVIDVGFQGLAASQARGDLPAALISRDFTGTGIETGLSHGTAVAEIVYDIAPASTFYLLKIANDVHLDNAVTYCINEGVHIIVHALGWFNTSFYDGTGVIARIVDRAGQAGILWVQAGGNFGRRHYGPTFTDANGDGWHDTEVTLTATPGDRILLYLTWDSWPETADDYDLYLFDPAGNLLASSTKTQAGAEQPTERIHTIALTGGTYRARIQRMSGATKRLALFSVLHDLSPHDSASSLMTPADVGAALSVAAIGWQNYTTGPAQAYSSRGPTKDGRQKPDLSGPDNVSTGVSPYNPFLGTSAAAAHVAGIAALVKSETTGLNLLELRSRVLAFCISMGEPYTYGAGRLEARPQTVALPDLVVDSITYTPTTPALGSMVSFTVVVRNQGTAAASQFSVRLQGAGPSQDRTVFSLAPLASTTLTFSLPLSTSPETFTATVDVHNHVRESNEGNNSRQVTITGLAALPDLVVDSITYTPTTPTVGSMVRFTVVVRNQGTLAASQFIVRLQGAGPFQDRTVFSLAAFASTTLSFSLPLSTSPETFTATVDVHNHVRESNEGNNTRQVTITGLAALPDLVVDSITYTPTTPALGSMVSFTVVVRNQGTAAASQFIVRLQGAGPSQDRTVFSLAALASTTLSFSLPLSTSPETFTATVDVHNHVVEANEGNNTRQVTITALAAPQATLTTDKSSYAQGEMVQIIFRNTGTVAITLPDSAPWVIKDAWGRVVFAPAAALIITTASPGETRTWTWNQRDNAGNQVPAGSYTVELRTINAGTFSASFTIRAPAALPDLVVDAITYTPTTPSVGATITFQIRVRNQGGAPAGLFYISLSGLAGTQYASVSALPAGASATVSLQLPLSAVSETFTVTVDANNDVVESDEGNNISRVTVTAVANQPPIASFTFSPANPLVNQWITFDATASRDPDGRIVSYAWVFNDGATATGDRVQKRYGASGTYTVTLTVTDDRGASASTSQTVVVVTGDQPSLLPGMPVIDRPGIYVWGDPSYRWHVTVAGSAAWASARRFRVVLSSFGTFTGVTVTPGTAPAPTLLAERRTIVWEGTVHAGWVDLQFSLTGPATFIMQLELYLDLDGDGDPVPRTAEEARAMVFLRQRKVNPPCNPMIFLIPEGEHGTLFPTHNFRIAQGTLGVHVVITTIEALEGGGP